MRKIISIASVLLVSACMVGQDYQRPKLDMPEQWQNGQTVGESIIRRDWWADYHDPVLNQLMDEGLKQNADLLTAAARVAQSRALLGLNEADLYPTLSMQGEVSRTQNSRESANPFNIKPFNNFGLAAVLDYEVDLWGKLQRATESARAELLASEYNRDAVRLAITSEIATGYFNLRALEAQMAVTQDTIESRKAAYDYQKAQYNHGILNELVYRQAESELATAKADLPSLQQARDEQETALAVLVGRTPKAIVENPIPAGEQIENMPVPAAITAQAPSLLLTRRPDIQAAEQSLTAANANIAVARADYFPTLSLSALLGLNSTEANDLLQASARRWQTGAAIAGPILDFGRTRANVQGAEAQKEQALIAYQQTIRVAFKDVVDAMKRTGTTAERVDALDNAVQAQSSALRVANARYHAGYSNYLEVLDAERSLYQSQLEQISAIRDRLAASVTLYKALGGGWDAETSKKAQK